MSTDTLERPSTLSRPATDYEARLQEPGDNERFAHYAPRAALNESMMTGEPVTALCGKTWTPNRDPQAFPVCPTCKEVYANVPPGTPEDEEALRGR